MRPESDGRGRITDMLEAMAGIEAAVSGHDATTFAVDRKSRDAGRSRLWRAVAEDEGLSAADVRRAVREARRKA